jgi:hypothetical protein
MFNNVVSLGYGLVVFGIVLGVGSIVLYNFAGTQAQCTTGFSWNGTSGKCWNGTDTATPGGTSYTNVNYMLTQLGTAGLAGWTPAVIAISVGMLFLGYFAIGKGRN